MATRKTVNGIKVKGVDDKTRHQIERAGTLEDQVLKAAELNVLDDDHYKMVLRGLKKSNKLGYVLRFLSLYIIYGYSLYGASKFILYLAL